MRVEAEGELNNEKSSNSLAKEIDNCAKPSNSRTRSIKKEIQKRIVKSSFSLKKNKVGEASNNHLKNADRFDIKQSFSHSIYSMHF